MKKRYVLILLTVVLLLTCLSGCGNKKVDLIEFASVTFTGLDGNGTANLTVNWSDFETAILVDDEAQGSADSLSKALELEGSIEYSINQSEGLSNGDEVTISVSYSEDIAKKYNLTFTAADKTVKVNDLIASTEIDAFEYITVEYSGTAPYAEAAIHNNASNEFLQTVYYSIDKDSNLSNGDIIIVTANYNEATAEEYAYTISETQKSFTVENVDEYITSFDQIDDSTFSQMKDQALDIVTSNTAIDNWIFYPDTFGYADEVTISGINLTKAYFMGLKEGMSVSYDGGFNMVYLVYEVKFVSNITEQGEDTVYLPVCYKNIILNSNGEIVISIADAYLVSERSNNINTLYNNIITANISAYNYEEKNF